jgi:uncharacterized protein
MHYAHRRRVKIWGEAQVVENDAELIAKPTRPGYRARPEQVMLFKVLAWDWNCSQHIPAAFWGLRCRSRPCRTRQAHRCA